MLEIIASHVTQCSMPCHSRISRVPAIGSRFTTAFGPRTGLVVLLSQHPEAARPSPFSGRHTPTPEFDRPTGSPEAADYRVAAQNRTIRAICLQAGPPPRRAAPPRPAPPLAQAVFRAVNLGPQKKKQKKTNKTKTMKIIKIKLK